MHIDLHRLLQRFQALSIREKLMVNIASVFVAWALCDQLVYQTLQKRQTELGKVISGLEIQLASQQYLLQQLKHDDQSLSKQQGLQQLQQSVSHLKQELYAGEKKFVSPEQMAQALRDMLHRQGNLQLLKLETLPVMPFGQEPQQPVWVYKHTLSLVVRGDFFSTLDYLKSLESLTWRVHWDSIDYKVDSYPDAETRIQVYTLSFEKDWFGA